MRQTGKNNRQRGRNRRNGGGHINRNTTLDSNGPDVRLRGNAFQLYEKYVSLGNDASAAGERISAEAYYQHADHYFRVHGAITAASEERRGQNGGGPAKAQDPAPGTALDSPPADRDGAAAGGAAAGGAAADGAAADGAATLATGKEAGAEAAAETSENDAAAQ